MTTPDTTATIKGTSKELQALTETLLNDLHSKVGHRFIGLVEIVVDDKSGPSLDGKRKVALAIERLEIAHDEGLDEYLRNLMRVLHQNRVLVAADGSRQQTLLEEQEAEPRLDDVIAQGRGFLSAVD